MTKTESARTEGKLSIPAYVQTTPPADIIELKQKEDAVQTDRQGHQ